MNQGRPVRLRPGRLRPEGNRVAVQLSRDALGLLSDAVAVPKYHRSMLRRGIVHIGVGNFHRAHMGNYLDRLFSDGHGLDWAVVGAGTRRTDARMRQALAGQDWLTTVVELDSNGRSARVIGSMIDFAAPDPKSVIAHLIDPAVRIVSMTITEGGYYLTETGEFDATDPGIQRDIAGAGIPETVFGMLIAALRARRSAGVEPFTIMSCDNLPENGATVRRTVLGLANRADPEMADWIAQHVAFPNSMVDCITPATSDRQRQLVADQFGIEDAAPVVCEPFRQWVLEERFPQGRPPLERVGVEFVRDVGAYELMKLRILNGGHAAIAYPAALLGHQFVHEAMADVDVFAFLDALQRREVIPLLNPISGVDYIAYLETIKRRFTNAAIGDTIPRLCQDGSNRQPKFILPSIRQALEERAPIDGLALEVALWCRYCAGMTEAGDPIQVDDGLAPVLGRAGQASRSDAAAFLAISSVFGSLREESRFVEAFTGQIAKIWAHGARKVIRDYVHDWASSAERLCMGQRA